MSTSTRMAGGRLARGSRGLISCGTREARPGRDEEPPPASEGAHRGGRAPAVREARPPLARAPPSRARGARPHRPALRPGDVGRVLLRVAPPRTGPAPRDRLRPPRADD